MIPDKETNKLYLSGLLKKRFPKFNKGLSEKLAKLNIEFNYLENTKDIWCRDYMPIQVNENKFVQFKFNPSYLNYKKYAAIRTNPKEVWDEMKIKVWQSNVVLDGGNVVKWKDKAIVTERIFKENPELNEKGLYDAIYSQLELDQLIIIPELKGEMTGHSDGIVRFIDENHVVINDYSKISKQFSQAVKYSLLNAGLKYFELPNEFEKNETGYDDTGDYVNILEMKDCVLIPKYNKPTDEVAMAFYKQVFNKKAVESIDCTEIAKKGGVLNCITWNIKMQSENNNPQILA